MIAQLNNEYLRTGWRNVYARLLAYFLFEGRPLTTKGRFINPVVFLFLKTCSRLPFRKKIEKPIFIVGSGRSGTTLLGTLLSIHSEVTFLNEPKALWYFLNANDDVIGTYSKTKGTFLLTANDATETVAKKATRVYSSLLALSGTKRVADKYPELIFRMDYVLKIFPDAKILYITRNISDTVLSNVQWNKNFRISQKEHLHDWWGLNNKKWKLICSELVPQSNLLKIFSKEINLFTDDKRKAAVEWILIAEKGKEIARKFSSQVLKTDYETLTESCDAELKKILFFCELPAAKKIFDYAGKKIRQQKTKAKIIFEEDFLNYSISLLSEN